MTAGALSWSSSRTPIFGKTVFLTSSHCFSIGTTTKHKSKQVETTKKTSQTITKQVKTITKLKSKQLKNLSQNNTKHKSKQLQNTIKNSVLGSICYIRFRKVFFKESLVSCKS